MDELRICALVSERWASPLYVGASDNTPISVLYFSSNKTMVIGSIFSIRKLDAGEQRGLVGQDRTTICLAEITRLVIGFGSRAEYTARFS